MQQLILHSILSEDLESCKQQNFRSSRDCRPCIDNIDNQKTINTIDDSPTLEGRSWPNSSLYMYVFCNYSTGNDITSIPLPPDRK